MTRLLSAFHSHVARNPPDAVFRDAAISFAVLFSYPRVMLFFLAFALSSSVYFLVIGDNKNNIFKKSKNIIYTGTIKDEKLMSIAYNSADFFILPSREDNLPNTMLESLCCGTPVLSFDISDSMEIIKKNNLGEVSNEMSSNSLKKTMMECINNSSNFDRGYISNFSKKLFNKSRVVEFYTKLYETKCNR